MCYPGICNVSKSEEQLLFPDLDMHFYLSLSYLRQIKASLTYSLFTISKIWQQICFVKSREILLMFCKSEVGIRIANVGLIQIYIVTGAP